MLVLSFSLSFLLAGCLVANGYGVPIHGVTCGQRLWLAARGVPFPWGQLLCRCFFIKLPGKDCFVCESCSAASNWRRGACIPAWVGITGDSPWFLCGGAEGAGQGKSRDRECTMRQQCDQFELFKRATQPFTTDLIRGSKLSVFLSIILIIIILVILSCSVKTLLCSLKPLWFCPSPLPENWLWTCLADKISGQDLSC